MIILVVGIISADIQNSQTVAQPLEFEDLSSFVETQFVTTYDPTLRPPKPNSMTKTTRKVGTQRPAFWLDIYTAAFLAGTSLLGTMLISWTIKAKQAKMPAKLFQLPGYAPRISTTGQRRHACVAGRRPSANGPDLRRSKNIVRGSRCTIVELENRHVQETTVMSNRHHRFPQKNHDVVDSSMQ